MAYSISIEKLQHVAEKVSKNVMLGPGYVDAEENDRMGVKMISGVQYKLVEHLFVRKGGITRRKVVGNVTETNIGYIEERELTAKLSVARIRFNADEFVETVFGVDANGDFPLLAETMEALLITYAEDLAACKWYGDATSDDPKLNLYSGWMTNIQNEINSGKISAVNLNLIAKSAISQPVDTDDTSAYDALEEWVMKLDPRLRKKCKIYCDLKRGVYIARAYANKFKGNYKVDYTVGKSYTIPELAGVEIVPLDSIGTGDCLIATIDQNFMYAVDTENNKSYVDVKPEPSKDTRDFVAQIQSIQGANIRNILPYAFTISSGSFVKPADRQGDYSETNLIVNADGGTVTVNGDAYVAGTKYAEGVALTLVATAGTGKTFSAWVVNGQTFNTASIQVVPKGIYTVATAIFVDSE
jgi:hypothetical protein